MREAGSFAVMPDVDVVLPGEICAGGSDKICSANPTECRRHRQGFHERLGESTHGDGAESSAAFRPDTLRATGVKARHDRRRNEFPLAAQCAIHLPAAPL